MFILDNPVESLIFSLLILMGLLIFFKIINYIDNKPIKTKEKKKTEVKKSKKSLNKIKEEVDNKELDVAQNQVFIDFEFSGGNYLYDRFVDNPSKEDLININEKRNSAFLTEEEYAEIKNRKIVIKVNDEIKDNELSKKLDKEISSNRREKEKLLSEFNNLSKEMKLLLIENILNKN